MLNKTIKTTFAAVGAITGITLSKFLFDSGGMQIPQSFKIGLYILMSSVGAILLYITANEIIMLVMKVFDRVEAIFQSMTLYELALSVVGLIAGLIAANLITLPISKVEVVGLPICIAVNIMFGWAGMAAASGKKDQSLHRLFSGKKGAAFGERAVSVKILDSNVIIDGRILDICRIGFLEGEFIVPSFVLDELKRLADSSDSFKRNKGRRGLDVLSMFQKDLDNVVRIENIEVEGSEADDKLIKAAKKLNAKIITNDYNLNKVAGFHNVPVLNINELVNAVKPIAIPGEEINVHVIKDGKENGQGVAYLNDGTMIVVDGGKKHIGETVNVVVTSVFQTAAGRMIFAKPKSMVEKSIDWNVSVGRIE